MTTEEPIEGQRPYPVAEFLTVADLARVLKVSVSTARRLQSSVGFVKVDARLTAVPV